MTAGRAYRNGSVRAAGAKIRQDPQMMHELLRLNGPARHLIAVAQRLPVLQTQAGENAGRDSVCISSDNQKKHRLQPDEAV